MWKRRSGGCGVSLFRIDGRAKTVGKGWQRLLNPLLLHGVHHAMKPIPWSCMLLAASINTAQAISSRPYDFDAQALIVNNSPCFYISSPKTDRPYADTEILVYEKQAGRLKKIWQVWLKGRARPASPESCIPYGEASTNPAPLRPNQLYHVVIDAGFPQVMEFCLNNSEGHLILTKNTNKPCTQ